MNINEAVMHTFYTAFAKLDYATMQDCYHPQAVFNDPVFGVLHGNQIRLMWQMLCVRAKGLSLTFGDIETDGEYGTCRWTAQYTFSKTGKQVTNRVKAHMKFREGKITEHTDEFDLYLWSRQAFGLRGWLLGWSGFMKNEIRRQALKSLDNFKP